MGVKPTLILLAALFAGACSTTPPVMSLTTHELWHDQVFSYKASDVVETKESLFKLDPEFEKLLTDRRSHFSSNERRLEYLASLLFNDDGIRISYTAGHSTGAAETWQRKRGDCMSLTLLTYAASQALGLDATMQEVRVPVAVDRRGGVDFVSGHVNVVVNNTSSLTVNGRSFGPGGVIIDFEPQIGSRRHGTRLSDDEIVARFYNNRASEYLAKREFSKAYAYYKAALKADPEFAPAYSNLAQIYASHGLEKAAEGMLNYAIALNENSDAPLRTLHKLLQGQGRTAEAALVEAKLRKHDEDDPYYWVGIGLNHLQNERFSKAIDALGRAEELTTGFEEIHRYLAIAYWRNGEQKLADRELATLVSMRNDDPTVKALSRKLGKSPRESKIR
jgi:tetratricopeptide (TPR) repeat protein